MSSKAKNVSELFVRWRQGDSTALDELIPLVYNELRWLARRYLRGERPGHTLQSADLVNEAYVRLIEDKNIQCQNRAHFLALAARLMRNILVDYAKARLCVKRGGDVVKVPIEEAAVVARETSADIIAAHDALVKLAAFDLRKSQVVELRYFGGLDVEETAEVLGISSATVSREWNTAKAWLYRQIYRGKKNDN